MGDLLEMIDAAFIDCSDEIEVCRLYAAVKEQTEKAMERRLKYLKEKHLREGKEMQNEQ